MSHVQIQCQNCGKTYKIPDTFKSPTAKCKACGSAIDVQSQLGSSAEEPKTKSTHAKSRRSSTRAGRATGDDDGGGRQSSRKGGGRSRRGRAAADDDSGKTRSSARRSAGSGRRGRRGHDEEEVEEGGRRGREKKKDNTVMVGAIVTGVLAIVVVVLVFVLWDDITGAGDEPKVDKTAAAEAAKKKKEAEEAKAAAARKKAEEEKGADPDAVAKAAKDAAAKKAAAKKAREAAAKKKANKNKVEKMEDAYKPKDVLKVIALPKDLAADRLKKINEKIETMITERSGMPFIRAQGALKEFGFDALLPIHNRLIMLDYTTFKDTDSAMPILSVVEEITGWDPQFAPAIPGEDVKPQMAHDNGRSIEELNYFMRKKWTSKAALRKWKRSKEK